MIARTGDCRVTSFNSGMLSDPSGPSALDAWARWLEAGLLGSVATSVAILAVAWLGLMLLQGRLHARRGVTTIVGAFVLFGAAQIATGLRFLGNDSAIPEPPPVSLANFDIHSINKDKESPNIGFDPYAGAAYAPPR